jgi:DNA-binding response OmpR family regulator
MRDKILIVEDDGMIAMLLEDILDALDREVSACVSSVDQALAYLEDHRPDAAIVDLRLGDEVSYPIMDRLRELDIPLAVASGYGTDIDRSRCGEDAVFIPKPYVFDDVERALEELRRG